MNRPTTALLSAFEAALVVAIGLGLALAPLTVLWGTHFGFAVDWWAFWRTAADVWLVGHGVDLTVTLDPVLVASLGVPGAEAPFAVTLAALGFALLTALLALRTGRRVAASGHRHTGELAAVATFAALALGITMSADHPAARPTTWQGVLLPTAVFTVGLLVGSTRERMRSPLPDHGSSVRDWIDDRSPEFRAVTGAALRGGAGAVALLVLLSSVALAAALVLSYAEVISLYERLHLDVMGGITVTLAELALLPNLVVWSAAWLLGPGFALGAGSTVSPLATAVGPLPGLPVLGALPTGELPFAFLGLVAPLLAGFLAAAVFGRAVAEEPWGQRIAAAVGMGVVAGLVLAGLAAASAGSAGPGRLSAVGPDPLWVGLLTTLEVGLAAVLGMAAAGVRPRRPR